MNWLGSFMMQVVTGIMSINVFGTTLDSFFSMSLIEGFTYLCENMTVGTFLMVLLILRLARMLSRALRNLIRFLDARLMAFFEPMQRDLFSQVISPKTIFNPGTLGMETIPSKSSSTFETAAEFYQ